MAELVKLDNFTDGYVDLVKWLAVNGEKVSPRGIATRELRGVTIELAAPETGIPLGVGRKLNLGIGAAETAQLVAGVSDAQQLVNVTSVFSRFTNNGMLLGAYGPRVYGQLEACLDRLTSDDSSRQAHAAIWRPDELGEEWPRDYIDGGNPHAYGIDPADRRDIPCTLGFTFSVRNSALHMHTTMRSNDVWLGAAYDFWQFTRLQMTLAWALRLKVGTYTHTAGSFHIYESDIDKIDQLTKNGAPHEADGYNPGGFGASIERVTDDGVFSVSRLARARAQALSAVLGGGKQEGYFDSSKWYINVLDKYRSGGVLCTKCRYVQPRDSEHFYRGGNEDLEGIVRSSRCKDCIDADGRRRIAARTTDDKLAGLCRRYGITVEMHDAMLTAQGGRCAICGGGADNTKHGSLVIDHDHVTGEVRGLLCNTCNPGLGMFKDNPQLLSAAMTYLEKFRAG